MILKNSKLAIQKKIVSICEAFGSLCHLKNAPLNAKQCKQLSHTFLLPLVQSGLNVMCITCGSSLRTAVKRIHWWVCCSVIISLIFFLTIDVYCHFCLFRKKTCARHWCNNYFDFCCLLILWHPLQFFSYSIYRSADKSLSVGSTA